MTLSYEDQDVDWKKHYIWSHDYASFTLYFPKGFLEAEDENVQCV